VKRLRFTPQAQADLQAIRDYYGVVDPSAVPRVARVIRKALELIAEQPGAGHQRDDLPAEVRVWTARPYLILYLVEPRPIQILAIIHSARDLAGVALDHPEQGAG
jgi:plasmid stabilization system protein ParE